MTDNVKSEPVGYRLSILDLRGWKPFQGIKKPEAEHRTFQNKAEAEAEKSRLISGYGPELVCSVVPIYTKAIVPRFPPASDLFPKHGKGVVGLKR